MDNSFTVIVISVPRFWPMFVLQADVLTLLSATKAELAPPAAVGVRDRSSAPRRLNYS